MCPFHPPLPLLHPVSTHSPRLPASVLLIRGLLLLVLPWFWGCQIFQSLSLASSVLIPYLLPLHHKGLVPKALSLSSLLPETQSPGGQVQVLGLPGAPSQPSSFTPTTLSLSAGCCTFLSCPHLCAFTLALPQSETTPGLQTVKVVLHVPSARKPSPRRCWAPFAGPYRRWRWSV